MGIAGLATNIEPYATRYKIEGLEKYVAIVDGPGLAYHAHSIAAASDLSRLPSYADITDVAVSWLKSLEDSDIKVSAILFDGALPATKKAERCSRMQQSIQRMSTFRSNHGTALCPMPRILGSTIYPLLAPALMEALSKSQFAQVTRNCPGEADDWCWSYATDCPRSIIFTSDTDLVLYEYSHATIVSFFRDATALPLQDLIVYSPTDICGRIKLSSLRCLGYAVSESPGRSLSENVRRAQGIDTESSPYLGFSRRYTGSTSMLDRSVIPVALNSALRVLDVRISEFVHQTLTAEYKTSVPEVYLPPFFEDTNQRSSWYLGDDLRLLAYSLLMPAGFEVVREYTRRGQNLGATDHHTLSKSEMATKAAEVSATVTGSVADPIFANAYRWPLLAVKLALRDLKPPPYTFALQRVINGHFDQTWEFVHLHARLQAVLYSLRILKQCTSVWLAINNDTSALHEDIARLNEAFATFPSISDAFLVAGQKVTPETDNTALQESIRDVYLSLGIEEEGLFGEAKSKRQRKREKREKKAQQRIDATNSAPHLGTNSYAVLRHG